MPLGLELNKTTNIDLTKKYKIINKEPNYWQGYNYYIEPNEKTISKALVICNDFNIIEAVILTIDKNKFEEFYNILKGERSTGQAPWYLCRPKGRVQAALAPYPPAPDVLYIV